MSSGKLITGVLFGNTEQLALEKITVIETELLILLRGPTQSVRLLEHKESSVEIDNI